MFELPSLDGVEEVVINREVVEGRAQPLYVLRRAQGGHRGRAGLSLAAPAAAAAGGPARALNNPLFRPISA